MTSIGDGPGGNDCFTSTDSTVSAWLDSNDAGWDLCENP